jgi:hypothetical protein
MSLGNGRPDDSNGHLGGLRGLDYPWIRKVPSGQSPTDAPSALSRSEVGVLYLTQLDRPRRLQGGQTLSHEVRRIATIAGLWWNEFAPSSREPLSGPAEFVVRLARRWGLSDQDLSLLLGLDLPEMAAEIRHGANVLKGRDAEDRVANLLRIFEALYGLLRDPDEEKRWLRQPCEYFGGISCLDIMLKGGIENLVDVRRWIEHVAGR